jgi:hypothetical protein
MMPPTAKQCSKPYPKLRPKTSYGSSEVVPPVAPPPPPARPSQPADPPVQQLLLKELKQTEVTAGANEYEPISVYVDAVTDEIVAGLGTSTRHLDMLLNGPFYPCTELNGRCAYKQEPGFEGSLYLFWCEEKGSTGWYVAEQPFLKVPADKELQV